MTCSIKTRLSPQAFDEVLDWIDTGRMTLDQMTGMLKGRGYDISRSTLGRFAKARRNESGNTWKPTRQELSVAQKLNLAATLLESIEAKYPCNKYTGQESVLALAYHAATNPDWLRRFLCK